MNSTSKSSVFLALLFLPLVSRAQSTSGTLYYTTFAGRPNVHRVNFNYDGQSFTLSGRASITSTPGADGIILAPDGNLLVGGQGTGQIFRVNPQTGDHTGVDTGQANAYHLTLDPGGLKVWSAGLPGRLAETSIAPFGAPGTSHAVTGDDRSINHLGFDGLGRSYYINDAGAEGGDGNGNFGFINLNTFVTSRLFAQLDGAHGMSYDPFTGDMFVFGHDRVLQIDLDGPTPSIIRNVQFQGLAFDQGTVDGEGHLFVASNTGNLFFMDYASDGLISSSHYHVSPFLANNLDDIAPLLIPEPSSYVIALGFLFAAAAHRRRGRRE